MHTILKSNCLKLTKQIKDCDKDLPLQVQNLTHQVILIKKKRSDGVSLQSCK